MAVWVTLVSANLKTAQAACPGLILRATETSLSFNSYSNKSFQIEVQRQNSRDHCEFFVGFSSGSSGSYTPRYLSCGNERASYNLHGGGSSSSPILKDIPEACQASEVLTGRFSSGTGQNQRNFTVHAALNDVFSPFSNKRFGKYTDTVRATVYESSFPPNQPAVAKDSVNLKFSYEVPKQILASLVCLGCLYTEPPQAVRSVDFGELRTGDTQGFSVLLIYNAGFAVTMSSQNGSRLRHTTRSHFVPYTLTVGGRSVNLPAGSAVIVATGTGVSPSAPHGHSIPVSLRIGSTAGVLAGDYQDIVQISVSSIE